MPADTALVTNWGLQRTHEPPYGFSNGRSLSDLASEANHKALSKSTGSLVNT